MYKYGNIGLNKVKLAALPKRQRDAFTQTSDLEDNSDYELSAMEKDILMCTGCRPGKLKKLRPLQTQTHYFSSD